ncbi:MAG: DNA primase [Pseudomonadota bacterium]|nr:DNA primase [Pseudomonadota bacterium]
MASFSPNFIDRLKQQVLLSDVMKSYNISLKKQGARFVCLSPLREEKTPSFSVDDQKGLWCDFGNGGHGGDAIKFIMEFENKDFPQAVECLAEIGHVPLEYSEEQTNSVGKKQAPNANASYKDLTNINAWAAGQFHQSLMNNTKAQQYATQERGLSPEIIERFGIGYAPDNFRFLRSQVSPEYQGALITADLLAVSHKDGKNNVYDKFRDRLIFPIRDLKGNSIAFGGRIIDSQKDAPKYLNSAETLIFKKGKTLYGLYESLTANRNPEKIIMVEGYMDVAKMHQEDFDSTVSTNGTAVTPDQVALAFRHTDHIQFAFDGDKAGFKAASKAMDNAMSHVVDGKTISFVFFPLGHDPDSILSQQGGAKMQELIDNAISLSDFTYLRITQGLNIELEQNLSKVAKNAVDILSQMPNGIYRDAVAVKIGDRLSLTPERILKAVDEHVQKRQKNYAANTPSKPNKQSTQRFSGGTPRP